MPGATRGDGRFKLYLDDMSSFVNWWDTNGNPAEFRTVMLSALTVANVITFFPECPHVCIGGMSRCCLCAPGMRTDGPCGICRQSKGEDE
jgi:hypothetical protein